jgi:hypothetical protein
MGIPLGRKATEAAESLKAAAKDASGFVWAVLAVAAAALLLGAVALVKAGKASA